MRQNTTLIIIARVKYQHFRNAAIILNYLNSYQVYSFRKSVLTSSHFDSAIMLSILRQNTGVPFECFDTIGSVYYVFNLTACQLLFCNAYYSPVYIRISVSDTAVLV